MGANMGFQSGKAAAFIASGLAALVPVSAAAETIPVRGVYAANADIPADVELIVVERFRGDLGQDVELALTEALANTSIRGAPWFDILSPTALRSATVEVEGTDGTTIRAPLAPDAQLRGTVRSEAIEREVEPKVERECVARDDDDKCVERREIRIECAELTVRVDPRILLSSTDGGQLYSHNRSRSESVRFCADEGAVPSILDIENGMVEDIVAEVRRDLAPVESLRNIRVMERRRDLRREDRRPFRNAVRATKESIEAACSGFEALEEANPAHISVLFNIGLCFESGGELEAAADYYTRALAIDPGRDYPKEGMDRVRSRQRAEAQIAEREAL